MDYVNVDIKRQVNSMVFLNVLSYSALSGCGIYRTLSADEYDELDDILDRIPPDQRPYNLFISQCLYKKGLPQYEQELGNPYDFASFKWVRDKQKKQIEIDVMTASIISCCNLIERILTFDICLENSDFIVYILYKTAVDQAKFIRKYLKVGSIFYNGEDTADEEDNELHIQITSENPDRNSQFAVMHAFSCLAQLSSYNISYLNCNNDDVITELNILPGLLTSFMENIAEYSTKELSLIGLHLTDMYMNNCFNKETISKALKLLAKEMCHRISHEGLLRGNRAAVAEAEEDIEESASALTIFNSLNLLSQLAFIFSSKSCYEASHKLYKQLSVLWDNEGRIFKIRESNKQSYKFKSITGILAALHSFSKIVHEQDRQEELQRRISAFADTSLFRSGIFNGQYYPILQDNKIELLEAISGKKPWAPVFNKLFEYKISKKKFYCEADMFRADDVIPSCALLLSSINS